MPEIQVRVIFDKVDPDVTGAEVLDAVAFMLNASALRVPSEVDPSKIKVRAVKAIVSYDRPAIERLIVTGRDRKGLGWSQMAEQLNDRRIPTMGGGKQWYASTIKAVYERASKGQK